MTGANLAVTCIRRISYNSICRKRCARSRVAAVAGARRSVYRVTGANDAIFSKRCTRSRVAAIAGICNGCV